VWQVEHRVEDRMIVLEIDDGPVWKDSPQACLEAIPVPRSEEAVAEEETAAQQRFGTGSRLRRIASWGARVVTKI
jgi:hypothetical protein